MSHHSDDFDPEMTASLKEALQIAGPDSEVFEKINSFEKEIEEKLGPTGKFPDGKLTKHDDGEIAFAVFNKEGKVIIDFNSPVHWLGMEPKQAVELGNLLIKHGREAAGR
jgi:hypothetical protein